MRRSILTAIAAFVAIVATQLAVVQPAAAVPGGDWLKNGGSNLCLDGSASQGVRMMTCSTTSKYQRWTPAFHDPYDLEPIALRNEAYSDMCLDGSVSSGARLLPCNKKPWQIWSFGGMPSLMNDAYGFDKALDGSASHGVRMNDRAYDSPYQTWRFVIVRT
ncbi:hypothetical protein Val02_12730 [Virgisporangium aliadipatigenens]|uniref:Ricin B lectin domain-containing protein n=1 Tax=Virgisporangium aliadipatigenens TaxID=741659 RepID=A0A8J3YH89_9ACTN|nr:RICIN domain-containing protein [Virgisporangium aliadipatigenens]GIJ44387.1 hypothetical protein Val02_12730 [Virgisporangium aliadipatigenens]